MKYILTTEETGKPIATNIEGLTAKLPPLADGARLTESIPAGTPYYDGFLISGFNWPRFFRTP